MRLALPDFVSIDTGIELLRVGSNQQTVLEMGKLFAAAKGDTSFLLEPTFQRTIDAYTSLDEAEIYDRLEQKYAGPKPPMIGYLVLKNDEVSGMMTVGKVGVEWKTDSGECGAITDDEGINFSQWYLAEKRGQGVGKSVAKWRLNLMRCLVTDDENWQGLRTWTSIRQQNAPSIAITQSLHAFDRIGEQTAYMNDADDMRRDVWVANSSF